MCRTTSPPASTKGGATLEDTDWHIHRLYDGLLSDPTTVRATFSRYVIDANRDPSGVSLYPGQNTTGLIPQTDFENRAIWREGAEPTEADIAARLAAFHRPYHAAIEAEIARVKAIHGVAILFDCHSIRSHLPFLFEGKLPDLNFGTRRRAHLRGGNRGGRHRGLRRRLYPGAERPLPRWLDDASLRPPARRCSCHPARNRPVGLSGERGRALRL